MKKWLILLTIVVMCLSQPLSIVQAKAQNTMMHVHFIDVGQADCILIQTPEHKNLLIDAGDQKSSQKVVDYLQKLGITTLDAVIATHPHHDHIGAMSAILHHFQVKAFYMPDVAHYTKAFRNLYEAIKKEGIMVFKAKAGDKIEVEEAIKINIVAPLKGRYDTLNDYSYVLKLVHKDDTFLLMADAGEQSEAEMLAKNINVKADVIKIGHHGGESSTTLPFLQKVDPDAAIISAGKHNPNRFPSKLVINRLRYLKIPTYRTDILGTIVAHSSGHSITFTFGDEGFSPQHESRQ